MQYEELPKLLHSLHKPPSSKRLLNFQTRAVESHRCLARLQCMSNLKSPGAITMIKDQGYPDLH